MHRSRRFALVAALAFIAGGILSPRSDAQDAPPAPKDPVPAGEEQAPPVPLKAPEDAGAEAKPAQPAAKGPDVPKADPPPTDEEDAAARKVLEAAAERQGGKSLAAPDGKLESFRIVFHKVTVFRATEGKDGVTTRSKVDSESPGLIVHWMQGQLRTELKLIGDRPVVRGVRFKKKADGTFGEYRWLWDGTSLTALTNEPTYAKDVDELERDRGVVKALLDVAVLRSMLSDGSRWKTVTDAGPAVADAEKLIDVAAFGGVALRRTPPANAEAKVHLTLWFDPESKDVTAACVRPAQAGGSTMYYTLRYHADFPKVKGDVLRFPFEIRVVELADGATEPQPVMVVWSQEASFNDLTDADFTTPVAPTTPK